MTTTRPVASREEWVATRLALLDVDKGLTRRGDELRRHDDYPDQ